MEKIKITISNRLSAIGSWIKKNKKEFIFLLVILLVGAFFRLYRIGDYMTFLGDEGRDAIIVRRLLVEWHPPLIGPGTSIGNMYLGPLYYYLMAPALFLAGFSPIGPAVQIALLGVATVFFVWFIGREWFGKIAGLVAAGLYAASPVVITYSRSSWNPNIMPFFSLLSIYSIWKVYESRGASREVGRWLIVLGISFAFVLQSHYLGLLLIPTLLLFWFLALRSVWRDKKKQLYALRYSLYALLVFLALMSPLLIFDIRHGWINFSAMKKFFAERQATVSARPWNAIPKIPVLTKEFSASLLAGKNVTAGMGVSFILWIYTLYLLIKFRRFDSEKKTPFAVIFVWLMFAFIGLGLYKQQIYDHYYGFIFPAPFLLLGSLSQDLWQDKSWQHRLAVLLGIASLIWLSVIDNPLRFSPNKQLKRARDVAAKIREESNGQRFNLAVIAERNYEDGYEYFLLTSGASVVDIDAQNTKATITDQLFAICELPKEKCDPTNNPKAEVARFGWSKVVAKWEVGGAILYKLVHTK